MLKVKLTWNTAMLDMTNNSSKILILNPKDALGILDLRSLGYHKMKQGVLQRNLSRFYEFETTRECLKDWTFYPQSDNHI